VLLRWGTVFAYVMITFFWNRRVATTERVPSPALYLCYVQVERAETMALYYEVRYGTDKGVGLMPHRYQDKRFRMRKSAGDPWIAVEEHQIESFLDQGYILRMSAKGHSPSGMSPDSIKGRKKP